MRRLGSVMPKPGSSFVCGEYCKDEIAHVLKLEAEDPILASACAVFESAAELHEALVWDDYDRVIPSELRNTLVQLSAQLAKMQGILTIMNAADEAMIDQYYFLANHRDPLLMNEHASLLPSDPLTTGSGFRLVTDRLKNAVDTYQEQLPPKGAKKATEHSYTEQIIILADWFELNLPKSVLTASKGTRFVNFVKLWIDVVEGQGVEHPNRRIKLALETRAKRSAPT